MASIASRIAFLRRHPPADSARVLLAAYAHAEESELHPIAAALLASPLPEAHAAVIARAHELGEAGEATLAAMIYPLGEAAARILAGNDRRSIHNLLRIVERRRDAALLPLLLPLLGCGDDGCAQRACATMISLVAACVGESGRRRPDAATASVIDHALAAVLETWPAHRQNDALIAVAIAAGRAGPALAGILRQEDHPGCYALRRVPARIDLAIVRRNLIPWLGAAALSRQSARWIHRLEGGSQFAEFLQHAHLLRAPTRRKAIRRAAKPRRCVPPPASVRTLPASAQAALPDLLAAFGAAYPRPTDVLRELIASPSALARVKAIRGLVAQDSPDANDALAHFAFDRDLHVARLAAANVLAGPAAARGTAAKRLERSAHEVIARRARRIIAASDAASFFDRWLELNEAERHAAAARAIACDGPAMLARLSAYLNTGDRAARLAAIALARRLRACEPLAAPLLHMAASDDARIASAAIAALGEARSAPGKDMLRAALRHENARVRANAVEAMCASGVDAAPLAATFTGDRANRPRANAVLGLLRQHRGAALPHLRAMLDDPDPLHRVSGVWVVRRARVIEVAMDLRRLIETDLVAEVRNRAAAAERALRANAPDTRHANARSDRIPEVMAC
jgi:hypothetical protein